MTTRLAALLGAFAALAPATALAAPTLAPLKPCYVSVNPNPTTGTESVQLQGSGFTPGSTVDINIDNVTVASAPIDGAGNLPPGTIKAPYHKSGQRDFVVTVVEQGNPAQTVSASSKVASLGVIPKPTQARPSSRITFTGSGFTDLAKPVWAHYVKGRRHKKTVRLGKPAGPCGTFKVKRKQFPFNPSTGRWIVQIDQQKKYSRSPNSVFVRLEIIVRRVLRRG